jgi:methionine-gamma-lyase
MGALATTVLALVQSGQHVVAQRSMYGGSLSLVQKLLSRFGVRYTLVDQGDVGAWADAITPETRLFLVESPSNPLLEITDLRAVAELAHARGILTAADNTFATPINQRPLEFGIDLVWHSATKYLGGHSDASAGAVAGPRELIQEIWNTSLNVGAVLGPFDAWLVTRGIRTLELRVGRHNAIASAIAQHLSTHPKVDAVHYPGLPTHASHRVAAGQMSGFGGVLSIEVAGGLDAAARLVEGLELFQLSASLGSVESLAVCPAAMWGALLTEQEMTAAGLRPGLVRLACGQEDARDLIEDLDRALDTLPASEEQ